MKRAEGEQEKLGPKDYLRERLRLGLTNSCSFSFTFPLRSIKINYLWPSLCRSSFSWFVCGKTICRRQTTKGQRL